MKWRFHTFWPNIFRASDSNNLSFLVLMIKPLSLHVENTIVSHFLFGDILYQLPCEYFQTLLFCLGSHTLYYLKCSSCQQWVSIHELIQIFPLYQWSSENRSSKSVGEMVTYNIQFCTIAIIIDHSIKIIAAVMFSAPHQKVIVNSIIVVSEFCHWTWAINQWLENASKSSE